MNALCWIELLVLESNTWNHLTVRKQMSSNSIKNEVTNSYHIHDISM